MGNNNTSTPVKPPGFPEFEDPKARDIEQNIGQFRSQENNRKQFSIQQIDQSSQNSEELFQLGFDYQIDKRKEVPDNRVHPYNGVGRIIYSLQTSSNKIIQGDATGFLITKKHVLTCAHIFRSKGEKKYLKHSRLQFFPEPLSKDESYENGIKAEILHIDHRYFQSNNFEGRIYDCAVLQLAENSKIRQQMVLKCNFEYVHKENQGKKDLINIPSYPSDFVLKSFSAIPDFSITKALFFDQDQAIGQEPTGILTYKHSPTSGASGAPLLLKKADNSYEVVGVHIGKHREVNCGILLRKCSLKQLIMSLVKKKAQNSPSSPLPEQFLKKHSKHQRWIKIKSNEQFKALADNGDKFKSLQNIDLEKKQIKDVWLKTLADNDDKFKSLQTINLQINKITDAGLKALAEKGDKFKSLQEINLWSDQITDAELKEMAENSDKFQSLQIINLGSNQITGAGLKALADIGDKFKSLQIINLSHNQITDAGLKALAEKGDKFKSLQTINLQINKITDAGLKALAENGNKFQSLQIINLGSNQITGAGLKALAEKGDKFKSLQTINLENNQITDAGLKALADNGHKFESLQIIHLGVNQITDAGLKALADNGDKFQSLQTINLSWNQITDAGLKGLADNCDKFQSLQTIDLSLNQITDAGIKQIAALNINFPFKIWH